MPNIIKKLSTVFQRVPTGDLKHITDTTDNVISTISSDLKLLDLEYVLTTSTGDWLDEWGSWFGVSRVKGEPDQDYSTRILATTTKPKNTIPALMAVIKMILNNPAAKVTIYEPYTNLFKFNISEFSGVDKIQDSVYQRHAVIDIHIDVPLPPNLQKIVEFTKSAGIRAYFTRVNQIGGGTVVRVYSDTPPKYSHLLETQLKTKDTDLHVIGSTLLGDSRGLISGRKTSFYASSLEFELGKIRMGRTLTHSRNTTIYQGMDKTLQELGDDYFNAVSYEREKELGKIVMLGDILVTDETLKTTNTQTMLTPDLYANSLIPMNIYLDKTVHDLYHHMDHNVLESNLEGNAYTKAFAGSMFPISLFLDESIGDISVGITFEQSTYSAGIQSKTTPA